MKIAFLCYNLRGGGAERMVSRLANAMAESGHETDIYLFDIKGICYEISEKVHIYAVGDDFQYRQYWKRIQAVKQIIQKKEPSVLFVFMMPLIPYALMGRFLSGKKTKIIGAERRNPKLWKGMLRQAVSVSALLCDGIIFQTEGAKNYYAKLAGRKGTVIGNIAPEAVDSKWICEKTAASVCSAGRLHTDKDFGTLIKAFQYVVNSIPAATLHIYGEGPQKEELENLAEKLGIRDKIIFEGFADNILEEFGKYEVFAFSSRAEGMPNVLLEAMSQNLPCVSANCDFGPADLIIDGKNGYLTETGDARMMADRIIRLLTDRNLRETMGINAGKVRERYSQQRIVNRYLDYAKKVCGRWDRQ